MPASHHGQPNRDPHGNASHFIDQLLGTAKREYPAGCMGADDDGALTYAMANDDRQQKIVIRFPKPVEWIGLGLKEAVELRDQLSERIRALRGVTT